MLLHMQLDGECIDEIELRSKKSLLCFKISSMTCKQVCLPDMLPEIVVLVLEMECYCIDVA